ncbi:hypothetical protein [Candidatus Nephthysia bennettiae]|uniref:Baseplate protein J-like domain-containing protein n=1 Tax=Candidatus Nephthysia bennettiae TaxID=3127016 RepID=A0A934KD29_9BACT|nr:hypothetical protein [Candidatus Dormibacteraeota bacterium]MBJ7611161.1 hypothetical protein [Candidatus Dormibacteraeota bacterium]
MSSVARDPGAFRSAPIFVESEEEIPAVIERLTRADADEVPLVLPARSRFGQSRFNFQLLRDYSIRLGKRVAIISPDPAVQRMAEENGFAAFRAVDQYQPGSQGTAGPAPAPRVVAVPPPSSPAAPSEPSPRRVGIRIAPPDEPARPGPAQPPEGPPAAAPGDGVPPAPRIRPQPPPGAGATAVGVPPVPPIPTASSGVAGPQAGQSSLPAASVRPRQEAPVRIMPSRSPAAEAARRPPRIKVAAPRPLPSRLAAQGPSRLVLYAGAILVLMVGMVAMAVYVPSAKVTLVTEASPFSADLQVSAEPSKAPIHVRTVAVAREATLTQKATGVKVIPGAVASGTVTYANNCPTGFIIPDGQVLVGAGGGLFAQKGPVTIAPKGLLGPPATVAAPIVAKAPGAAGNVPGGPAALQPAGDAGSCLVAATSATAGGTDEQKKIVVSTADYDSARSSLETQVRGQSKDELTKQLQNGEKLADPPVTLDSAFRATKKVDEEAADFQATLSVKIEGAYYVSEDVNRAFGDAIQKQLPAGQQLTGNRAKVDYGVSSTSAGGHLTFRGKASGYQAPRLDLPKLKSQLPGQSTSKVRTDLARLPGVRSVQIDQSPFKLPILPLVGSRIDLQYVVSQAPPTRSG